MALFNVSVWQRSRFTLQWFIITLVGSLACLTAVALAQFEWSEGVSGSVSIPDVVFTCLGNLAVFMTAFIGGRLDMENGARDVLATTRGPRLNVLMNGRGLTTCRLNDRKAVDVVLLSKYKKRPRSSLTQFMQYISHSHDLESILLQFLPFTAAPVTAEICKCDSCSKCQCVVFWATEEITVMLAHRLPGTLKRLSEFQCLLPCPSCLKNGCHGCNQGLLYVEDLTDVEAAGESSELGTSEGRLREYNNPRVDSPAAVCEALNESLIEEEESSCICIPVHPRNTDRWTKFMIKFLKSKDKEIRGIKVVVSDALQHYITDSARELWLFQSPTGCIVASEKYDSASLILPRVAEVIVNMVLTGWLRVDGLSSSLVARRAIKDHVVDSARTGFGANAVLTEAAVFCSGSGDGTNVCQVLWFRSGILSARRVSYMVGCVNLICSITWTVLIACEGNWAPSMPLSTLRVSVIIGAVGVALGIDCFEVYDGLVLALFWAWAWAWHRARRRDWGWDDARYRALLRYSYYVRVRARARPRCWCCVRSRAQDRDLDLVLVRDRARAWAWAWAPLRGLAVVVILEVGCIASLVVTLSMNKGLGRWVYSGMQVLVWVRWGIGSFLLGDKATEDEDGSPYLFWTRRRGTWVYCSAFLLNATLAGVRGKWKYSI